MDEVRVIDRLYEYGREDREVLQFNLHHFCSLSCFSSPSHFCSPSHFGSLPQLLPLPQLYLKANDFLPHR